MEKYLVMTSIPDDVETSWAEALQRSCGVCNNFAKAYEIGLFLAGIVEPDLRYRKSLEIIKVQGAVTVQDGKGRAATIVRVKHYT